jgi:rRNA maturation RNase YbeY
MSQPRRAPATQVYIEGSETLPPGVSAQALRTLAARVLASERKSQAQMTLLFGGDEQIRDLNNRYRDFDAVTDVLSFPAQETTEGFVQAPTALDYIGDVMISVPQAGRQAEEADHSLEQELRLLVAHGTLHLLGYDHATAEDREVMWAMQEELLVQGDDGSASDLDEGQPCWRTGVLASFGYAAAGLRYLLTTQRSIRIQIAVALLAIVMAAVLGLTAAEWALLTLTIGLVLVAEMFNSVTEVAVDAAIQTYHPLAKVAKDVAAGAVLFAAIVSAVVGLLLLVPKIWARIFG